MCTKFIWNRKARLPCVHGSARPLCLGQVVKIEKFYYSLDELMEWYPSLSPISRYLITMRIFYYKRDTIL